MLKQLVPAVLFGLVFSIPSVMPQTSSFSQQGKVTHELRDEGFSIAHSSLPLNSKAKVVNTSTGKEVEVTINRLIPASLNRIADVSSSVWQELGLSPGTDVRIYTSLSENPQTAALPAARQQESAARIGQTEAAPDSLPGNQQSWGNTYIYNYGPSTQTIPASQQAQSFPASQAAYTAPASQQAQSAPVSQTQSAPGQQAQSAPGQQAQAVPGQQYQSAPGQQYQSAPAAQAYQPSLASQSAPAQQYQSAPAQQTQSAPAQQYQSAPGQQAQSAPAVYSGQQAAAQSAPSNDLWAQLIKPPASSAQTQTAPASPLVYTPPQTARPAAANDRLTVTDTSTSATWTRVIIDASPQTPRPSVTVNNRE